MKAEFFHKIVFPLVVFNLLSFVLSAQNGIEPSKLKQFNITVNFDDYTVKTQMLSQNKKVGINNDKSYLWYTSQKIMETRGGYDGKLIHGTYKAFYLNNQLKEQGEIRYGLRHKEWKYWYADGKLKEVINWKNGVKNGAYYLYNDYGQLMAKSNFRNDKLNGKFYTYGPNGKILEKKRYRKGEEITPKVKARKPKAEKTKAPKEPKVKKEKKKQETDSTGSKTPFLKRIFKKKARTAEPASAPSADKKKSVTT